MLTNREIILEAYQVLKDNFLQLIVVSLVYMAISVASQFMMGIGFILSGPLSVGLAIYFLKLRNQENPEIADLFEGFKNFGNSIGTYLLTLILITLGFLLLIVPGIVLALGFSLVFYIIAEDYEINPIDTLKKSYRMMEGHKLQYFWLLLACCLISLLGVVFTLGLGIFVTLPFMSLCSVIFYEEVKSLSEEDYDRTEIEMIGS